MPLKRTPPPTPAGAGVALLTCSDPNLSTIDDSESPTVNITQRNLHIKRKREEIIEKADFDDFKLLMTNMFKDLKDSIQEIKAQNAKLQESVDLHTAKYEEMMEKIHRVEKDRAEDRAHINQLEDRLEQLERQNRASGVEIRNIPKLNDETKQSLTKMVEKIGKTVNMNICESDVRDIFRVNAKSNKPILVDFTSVQTKEKFLFALKNFNKTSNEKLNTGCLGMNGPTVPIFISENLTTKMRRLFFVAREFSVQHSYKYCWTSYGKVFLRKEDGAALIRVESDADIDKLRIKL